MKFIIQALKIFTEHYNIVCSMLIPSSKQCCHIDGKNAYFFTLPNSISTEKNAYNQPDSK
jgi:hypothetical protein